MKKVFVIGAVAVASLMTGCTDAFMGKIVSLGNKAEVTCYSGGKIIHHSISSGKVKSEANSDGYYFVPEGNSMPVEVSGDCEIKYLPN